MRTLRILVVEDDPMIGMLIADMLEMMNHEVCAIETSELGAVATAARCKPDLMIVDVRLEGGGSGINAVEEILRTGFVSHFFMSGNIAKVKALRPDAAVLEKPFFEADLVGAIQRALDHMPINPVVAVI